MFLVVNSNFQRSFSCNKLGCSKWYIAFWMCHRWICGPLLLVGDDVTGRRFEELLVCHSGDQGNFLPFVKNFVTGNLQ